MFKCNKCGQCCRNLNLNSVYKELHNGDGICIWLNEKNECSIYDNRPLLCRIDEGYNKFFKDSMTIEEYYYENYKVCKMLRRRK